MTPDAHPVRRIRSFVRREGRMTGGQRRALAELLPRFGVEPGEAPLDFAAVFNRRAPVKLEIGFGDGEALAQMAATHPEHDYLGMEVHRPGVGRLLMQLEESGIGNVRVICADAKEVLQRRVPAASLDAVYVFFPDPWPKKRHHKRRLIQPDFVALVRERLKSGGVLHAATDWEDYARHILEVLSAAPGFENAAGPGCYAQRPGDRPETKFERRGQRLGHGVWDLVFRKR